MAWEMRERGDLYYVRKLRRNGRVVSEYVGCGETARIVAHFDRVDRVQRQEIQRGMKEEQAELMALDRQHAAYCARVEATLRQALEAAGYHQHHRGEWRKRREHNAI